MNVERSALDAASATFVLKAGVWFRRGRLIMVSPLTAFFPPSGRNATYRSRLYIPAFGLIVSIPRQFSASALHVGKSGMVVVLIFGNSPQSKWRILIRSMIGSNSSKDAAALRQSSGAPTWGAWTIGAVEWMSGAQGVVAAQNPDSPRLLELGTFFISG